MSGGGSSLVHAYKAVGIRRSLLNEGPARIEHVDVYRCVDCLHSYEPLLVGHAHEEVVSAVQDAAAKGTSLVPLPSMNRPCR